MRETSIKDFVPHLVPHITPRLVPPHLGPHRRPHLEPKQSYQEDLLLRELLLGHPDHVDNLGPAETPALAVLAKICDIGAIHEDIVRAVLVKPDGGSKGRVGQT